MNPTFRTSGNGPAQARFDSEKSQNDAGPLGIQDSRAAITPREACPMTGDGIVLRRLACILRKGPLRDRHLAEPPAAFRLIELAAELGARDGDADTSTRAG
jgi:hypothetical protein